MAKMISCLLSCAAIVLFSWSPAYAQPRGGGRGGAFGGGDASGLVRAMPFFQALDKDRNGELSFDELDSGSAALKALDKNGDQKLTTDELVPAGGRRGGRGGRGGIGGRGGGRGGPPGRNRGTVQASPLEERLERIMALDRNNDNQLDKLEAGEPLMALADKNRDSVLSRDEIVAALELDRQRSSASTRGSQ